MKTAMIALAASALAVSALAANAATIQNRDQSEYQLRIIEDGNEQRLALLPNQEATDLCKTKCQLYIGSDPDPYDLVAADALVIEGGQLYETDTQDSKPGSSTPNQ